MTPEVASFSGSAEEWDSFVFAAEGGTACHLHGWRTVLEAVFGHECLFLAARAADGGLAGLLPLVRVRSIVFGHYLVSMPFLNAGGPIGDDGAIRALAMAAKARARADKVKLLELRSVRPLSIDLPVSHRKITVVLDLPSTTDALFKGFPAKLRSQIRRPEKAGVEARFGPDQLGPFYRVFARHMRDLGTPVLPRRFFEAAASEFGERLWFGCAWLGGVPIAGGAGFRFGDEFEMTWASSLHQHASVAANMGLYWAFMRRAREDGANRFNFGRCTPESGTHRFKRQWGSRDEPLYWYQDTPAGGLSATPSPDAGAFALGPRLWRRLPVPLANALGPRIVRYIP